MTKREEKCLSHLIKTSNAIFASNRNYADKVLCDAQDFINENYGLDKYDELVEKEEQK